MNKTPTTLIIMDGFGLRTETEGNAVAAANTPRLDQFFQEYAHTELSASGLDVGLPAGQMGNSEVGHTNIGAGRVVFQDLPRISKSIDDGDFFQNPAYVHAMDACKEKRSALHLMGLLSDGGVHSHIDHLFALMQMAKDRGLERVYIHAFLDGRDVSPTSGADYVTRTVEKCRELGLGCDIIPKVEVDGITVSSTYIRELVESGDVEMAARFLGHRHCMTQTVGHGQRLGRTIGIPTVNLTVPEHVLTPKFGVYVSRVYLPDGRSCAGVTNVGTRPTVSRGEAVSVETFLLDFDGDLYGQDIRLEFCKRLRGEVKFDSLEALREEIQKNIRQTRAYFEKNGVE